MVWAVSLRAKAMHESYLSGTRTHTAKMFCKQMFLTRIQRCVPQSLKQFDKFHVQVVTQPSSELFTSTAWSSDFFPVQNANVQMLFLIAMNWQLSERNLVAKSSVPQRPLVMSKKIGKPIIKIRKNQSDSIRKSYENQIKNRYLFGKNTHNRIMGNYGKIMGKLWVRYGVPRLRINRLVFSNNRLWPNYDPLWEVMGTM